MFLFCLQLNFSLPNVPSAYIGSPWSPFNIYHFNVFFHFLFCDLIKLSHGIFAWLLFPLESPFNYFHYVYHLLSVFFQFPFWLFILLISFLNSHSSFISLLKIPPLTHFMVPFCWPSFEAVEHNLSNLSRFFRQFLSWYCLSTFCIHFFPFFKCLCSSSLMVYL